MITNSDNKNCYENNKYYFLINPKENINVYKKQYNLKKTNKDFSYNSFNNKNYLSKKSIGKILKALKVVR